MIIPNAHIEAWSPVGSLSLYFSTVFSDAAGKVIAVCRERHNGFVKVSLDAPFKLRTFGPGSQSAHLHGHLQQLAVHFGYTLGEMKEVMKRDVPDWPWVQINAKRAWIRPESEAMVSSSVESKAIEWTHLIAAEEGLELVEGKEV